MIDVEIWSDVVCPFCFIGKRNFEEALQKFESKDQVRVTWRSFELDPNALKNQKVKIEEVLAKKYGRTVEWAQKANQDLARKAKAVGLNFNFDRIIPNNSFDAHRLMHLAAQKGRQDQMAELLFAAYFVDGQDISSLETLERLALQAGLEARTVLNSKQFADQVRKEETEAFEFSITGVPAFVFNRKFLVSGAQPPEAFLEALREAQKPD